MSDPNHQVPQIIEHSPPATRLHPLVQMMQASMQGGVADPATLREMMALQREWQAGEAKRAYTQALVALKADLPSIIDKDHLVDFGKGDKRVTYRHATLANVMDQITGPLSAHGFALTYTAANAEGGKVSVSCHLTHADGHSEQMTLSAAPDSGNGRSAIQGIASSITYLQRYSALALLGIATKDMEEPTGEQAADDATVDPERNLSAVTKLAARGRSREAAEARVGRPVSQWTIADLRELQSWAKGDAAPVSDAERKAKHHPSWPADQRGFFAALTDLGLAQEYESVAAYASVDGGPRPSGMDGAARADLLGYLATEAGMKHYRGFARVGE